VSELVADMEQLLRRTLGAHIDIELRAAEDLWLAKVDPAQLENALLNLALNARDAMPSGGRLTIETRNVDLDERDARPNGIEPGAYVMVAVGDDGIGMTPPVMTRAFEPFFTTKDVGKGTGLGLSMVYGFAKQSGGHVKIQSAVNVGTVVKLYLPRSAAEAARFGSRPSFPVDLPTGTEAILLIEDDPLVRMHVADLLGSLGYRITAVENAVQALAVLEDSPTPDLLFTDIVMPGGINGFDLVRRVRERWPRVKVLMMTGYPGTPETAEKQIGGTTMLGKPFSRSEVASKIRQVLDEPAVEAGAGMDAARYVA
jgi:CheY-like chemotaxis protein